VGFTHLCSQRFSISMLHNNILDIRGHLALKRGETTNLRGTSDYCVDPVISSPGETNAEKGGGGTPAATPSSKGGGSSSSLAGDARCTMKSRLIYLAVRSLRLLCLSPHHDQSFRVINHCLLYIKVIWTCRWKPVRGVTDLANLAAITSGKSLLRIS
jgi:hypothetical protein